MKKLLFIAPHLSTGGAPQYLLKKIQELLDCYEIYCVEYSNVTGGVLVVQRNQIENLLRNRLITLGEDKKELLNYIKIISPDIIHFEEMPEFFCDDKISDKIYTSDRKYIIVETSHDSSFDVNNKRYFPDKFIFVSKYQKQLFSKLNIPSDVIEYPIEYKLREIPKEQMLEKLGLNPKLKHVINVGLFTPRKNQKEIIEYARRLKNYPIQFHFIGNQADNFKDYWEPLMKEFPDNCHWWGERKDVDSFYQIADLFLFTSRGSATDKETMPLVIKEAISWKVPSLIYNLPVYLNYFDKYNNIKYLDFDNSIDNNCKKILDVLDLNNGLNSNDISIHFDENDNKITVNNLSSKCQECYVVIKDYLSKHTVYWFEASISGYNSYWAIPCPKNYFFSKICNNNNFKGYEINFIDKLTNRLLFSKDIIIDEHATNYEPTLLQNPFNCSYINYVEFFCKKYFDDYYITENDIFVDVGANDGLVTEWAISRGFKKIYCLEPDKRSVKYLKQKFIDNENVVIIDKALFDKNEYDVKFYTNTDTTTVSTLIPRADDTKIKQNWFLSETMTFSRLLSDYKIDTISLLKIDIEGAEFDLLKSMTEEQKNRVKYFLIECHFLNDSKIKTLFDVFRGNYDLEFRDHINDNVIVDINDLNKHDMLTLFVINKNLIKTTELKKKPKIHISHLLTSPDSEREIKSIESISKLENAGTYTKIINSPYNDIPPVDTCFRPNDIALMPGFNKLTSRHYGCYKAHTDAILNCNSDEYDYFLFFECDAVIVCDIEEFINKANEAFIICKKYGYNFFSFGATNEVDQMYVNHKNSKKMIEAHAYLIPSQKIKDIQNQIKTKKWDVFDLWVSYVMDKQRIGFFHEPLCLQAKGESLIDRQISDKNFLGINKI